MLTTSSTSRWLRARGRVVTALLAVALVTAGCGDPDAGVQQDPGGSLRDAFVELSDYEGYELRFGLDLDEVGRDAAVAGGGFTPEEADLLADSSLLVRTEGRGIEGSVEYSLIAGGDEVIGLKVLPDLDIYLRVDFERLFELADDPDAFAGLDEFVATAEQLGLGELAAAARAGGWIRIAGLEQIMAMYEGMIRGMLGADLDELEEMGEQLLARLVERVGRFLEDGVTVVYVGSEELGEHVRATAGGDALRTLVADLVEELMTAFTGFSAFGELEQDDLMEELRSEMLRDLEEAIPSDFTLTFDAWISGGRLTQVAVDLAQFPDAPDGRMLITLGLDEFTGTIDPPDDATEVDLFWLLGRLMGTGF